MTLKTKRTIWILAGMGLLIGATVYFINGHIVPGILDGVGSILSFVSAYLFHKLIKTAK